MHTMYDLWRSEATNDDLAIWYRWGAHRFLSILQAAVLLSGHEPSTEKEQYIQAIETKAMLTRITQCVLLGELSPLQAFEWACYPNHDELKPIENGSIKLDTELAAGWTTITTTNLAEWAEREGIPHGWKLPSTAKPATAKVPAVEYPEKLQAAIDAFHAVKADPGACRGTTPKQAILKWLGDNRPDLKEDTRERIASIANWKPQGGAPPTPTG